MYMSWDLGSYPILEIILVPRDFVPSSNNYSSLIGILISFLLLLQIVAKGGYGTEKESPMNISPNNELGTELARTNKKLTHLKHGPERS